ncbi:MAG: DUF2808 domain-containing protein [Snowella sp.]
MSNFPKSAVKSSQLRLINFSSLAYGCLLTALIFSPSAQAEALKEQPSFFQHTPYLIQSSGVNISPAAIASVTFSIQVPANARQSLKAITINPITNVETIAFKEADTRAVMGEDYASGTPLALSSIGGEQDPNDKSTTLVFDQPIEPGNTVTVRLKVEKNPLYGGIYLLKITAFPDNQNGHGLPLGNIRLHFPGSD